MHQQKPFQHYSEHLILLHKIIFCTGTEFFHQEKCHTKKLSTLKVRLLQHCCRNSAAVQPSCSTFLCFLALANCSLRFCLCLVVARIVACFFRTIFQKRSMDSSRRSVQRKFHECECRPMETSHLAEAEVIGHHLHIWKFSVKSNWQRRSCSR